MTPDVKNSILLHGSRHATRIFSDAKSYDCGDILELAHLLHAARSSYFYEAVKIFKEKAKSECNPVYEDFSALPLSNFAQAMEDKTKKIYGVSDSLLSCSIGPFSEEHVFEGLSVFPVTCPTCEQKNFINFSSDYVHDNILFCPQCFQKLVIDKSAIIKSVRDGILEIGKRYLDTGNADELAQIILAGLRLKKFADLYFIKLRSERIGHYIGNTFGFFSILNDKELFERSIFFAFDNHPPCNKRVKEFLQNYISMPAWVKDAYELCSKFPQIKHMAVDVSAKSAYILDYGQLHARKPLRIEFTNAEHELARDELRRLGVDYGKPFICFMGRDSKYINESGLSDASIHECRNMDIQTFLPTMRWFASRGIFCLRIGHTVMHSIVEENPYIIDCSTHTIDRILDFYIPGNCIMNISILSGPIEMSYLRRIPTLIVNQVTYKSFTGSYLPYVHIIFKKYYSLDEEKYLSFEYVLRNRLDTQVTMDEFKNRGLRIDDNTSDEILNAAKETWFRLHGDFPNSVGVSLQDALIQDRYRYIASQYAFNKRHTNIKSYIAFSFAQKNHFFLEN